MAKPVDLSDLDLHPPLINAHDHLELNHFPRTTFRDRYPNAHEWGDDVSAHLDEEPLKSLRSVPLNDQVFIGGLKNLLSGALFVLHHNPPHRALFARGYPVQVIRRYRWAHSLHFSDPESIRRAYRQARLWRLPFVIHLAEGTDAVAADELARLETLLRGDLSQVVLVHGVGLTPSDIARAAPRVRGLVICPTTNRYLLGEVPDAHAWVAAGGKVAIGSDSRLTSDGDLLDERRVADAVYGDLPDHAQAITGVRPQVEDLIATRKGITLKGARRSDLALVLRGGIPRIGDPNVMARFARTRTVPARLDGVPKSIEAGLARQIAACGLSEPGLELL